MKQEDDQVEGNGSGEAGGTGTDHWADESTLSKEEFARKLNQLLLQRGWTQSDLARHSGINRTTVNTYTRGRSLPQRKALHSIALALGMKERDLLPNTIEADIERTARPTMEFKQSADYPGRLWVRINRLVTEHQAMRLMQILTEDEGDG